MRWQTQAAFCVYGARRDHGRFGTLRLEEEPFGILVVHYVEYYECDACGGYLFPLDTAEKIGEVRDRRIREIAEKRKEAGMGTFHVGANSSGIDR